MVLLSIPFSEKKNVISWYLTSFSGTNWNFIFLRKEWSDENEKKVDWDHYLKKNKDKNFLKKFVNKYSQHRVLQCLSKSSSWYPGWRCPTGSHQTEHLWEHCELAPLSGGKNRPSRGFTCCQACLSSPSYASCCAEIPLRVAEKCYCPIAYNNCLGKRILVNTVPWSLWLQFRRELETDRLLTNVPLPSKFIAHLLCTLLSRDIKIDEPEASAEERGRGLALLSHPTYVSSYSL